MMAGAQFKKWFWVCMNIGLAAATAFIMWLWYQTTFQINALCLFCMIVWGYDHHAFCEDHGPQYFGGCYSGFAVDA